MTKIAETGVSVHDLNLFSYNDVSEHGEEGKDSGHGRLSVDDKEWDVVDLEAIGEMMDSRPSVVCMCDYDDLMSSVNQLLLVYQPCCTAGNGASNELWRVDKRGFRHHLIRSVLAFK